MTDEKKIWWSVVAIGAIVGIFLYTQMNKNYTPLAKYDDPADANKPQCPDGQVPCGNGTPTCYDPKNQYLVDPCGKLAQGSAGSTMPKSFLNFSLN